MIVLHMVAHFFSVVVLVGPGFPFEEVCLGIEILAGQANDVPVRVGVNDGVRVLLVERIAALFIKHGMYLHSDFFGEI